jgi:thiol:disulfide interchange protein DsbD
MATIVACWALVPGTLPASDSSEFDLAVPGPLRASFEPASAKPGQTVTWKLTGRIAPGWHTYPVKQPNPKISSSKNDFEFPAPGDVIFVGQLQEPDVKEVPCELGGMQREIQAGEVVWKRPVVVSPEAKPGAKMIKVSLDFLICNKDNCLPPRTLVLEAPLTVTTDPPVDVDKAFRDEVIRRRSPTEGGREVFPAPGPRDDEVRRLLERFLNSENKEEPKHPISVGTSEEYAAQLRELQGRLVGSRSDNQGLLAFVLAGVFWGAVSLVTPCVFPMIPITVSYFLKQSEKSHHRPVTMAVVYCATIVIVLTVAAVLLLSFFRFLSINPWMNIGMGVLFIVFALSLFGMYDIELPSSLAQFTSAREGRGGLIGTVFMALTFTILSFACVAPFLGGFGGTAATASLGPVGQVLGAVAFSVTFAAPFFLLALFPSLLKKLPKSGNWLNSVKVVMGFLELAAAFKFFRTSELVRSPAGATFFTYDFVLGIWIALSILCGLYLLNLYRLPHDTPAEHLGVPRLLLSAAFLGLGFYLIPALFKYSTEGESQRPRGVVYAWVDAFLLPEPTEGKASLPWTGNLRQAIEEARAPSRDSRGEKLVFVDLTGKTCTNCKINEQNVFSKPEFKRLFQSYKLVQLYTDEVPNAFYTPALQAQFGNDTTRQRDDAHANLKFQREAFGTEQLPLYVILKPQADGKIAILGRYDEGKINDEAAFAKFLKDPIEGQTSTLQAHAVP